MSYRRPRVRIRGRRARALALALLASSASAASAGCALFSRGDVINVRWFSPESTTPRLTSGVLPVTPTPASSSPTGAAPAAPASASVELGRISSGSHLRERIAHRDTAFELGYYDDKRWTERPEMYVRREVAKKLFEERGLARAVDGEAPTLDLDLEAFEEVRANPSLARIQLRILLHDDRQALLEKTITVERPIAPTSEDAHVDALVRAMSEALGAAADQVATETEAAVRRARAPAAPPPAGVDPTAPALPHAP